MKKLILTTVLVVVALLSFQAEAMAQRTGVYVNNREITVAELQQLQQVTGPLGRAAYYIDQQGNFGVVGYYPVLNIHQRIAQLSRAKQPYQQYRQQQSGNYYRQGTHGYYGREGGNTFFKSKYSGAAISGSGSDAVISGPDGKVIFY